MALVVVRPDGTVEQHIRIPPGFGEGQRTASAEWDGRQMSGDELRALFGRGYYYGILPDQVYAPVYNQQQGFSPAMQAWVKYGIPRYQGNPNGALEPAYGPNGYPPGMSGPAGVLTSGAPAAYQDSKASAANFDAGGRWTGAGGGGNGGGALTIGNLAEMADVIGEAVGALASAPTPPVSTGDVATDLGNLAKYHGALAAHGSKVAMYLLVGEAIRTIVAEQRPVSLKLMIREAGTLYATFKDPPAPPKAPTAGAPLAQADVKVHMGNLFTYLGALTDYAKNVQKVTALSSFLDRVMPASN